MGVLNQNELGMVEDMVEAFAACVSRVLVHYHIGRFHLLLLGLKKPPFTRGD